MGEYVRGVDTPRDVSGGHLMTCDIMRVFGLSIHTVSRCSINKIFTIYRNNSSVRSYKVYDSKQVAGAIIDGEVVCEFMGKEVSDEEALRWAYEAFSKTIQRSGLCPSGAALIFWRDAISSKLGGERLTKWKYKSVNARPRKKKDNDHEQVDEVSDSDGSDGIGVDDDIDISVAEGIGAVDKEPLDEDEVRIDEHINRAIASGKIDAPYRGQDAEANRKQREMPIYIPNLDEV